MSRVNLGEAYGWVEVPPEEYKKYIDIKEQSELTSEEVIVSASIIEQLIEVGTLHSKIDFLFRNSLITGKEIVRLRLLVQQLTQTATRLEKEIMGPSDKIEPNKFHCTYNLESVMDFGKWKGHTVRDVIQINPVYVMWAHDHVKQFKLPSYIVDALVLIL